MIHSQFNLNISVKDVYNDKPPGEGESFAAPLKIYTTGLAGRSFANPETFECDFLSRGLVITHIFFILVSVSLLYAKKPL